MLYNVLDFGASGDGKSLNTAPIQQAIDACFQNGGGKVHIPAGTFLTGTIELKSNVFLELSPGAVLLASPCESDYRKCFPAVDGIERNGYDSPFNKDQHLIFALGANHTGILGEGRIHANGRVFYNTYAMRRSNKQKADGGSEFLLSAWRPGPSIAFLECTDVTLHDFAVCDNPQFAVMILHCRNVMIDQLRISCDKRFINGDGIHVKSSQEIFISNCNIDVEDDAICFYTDCWRRSGATTLDMDYGCRNVLVSNCILSTACSAVRIGFMGNDPICNLAFHNLIVRQAETVVDILCCGGNSFFCDNETQTYGGALIENLQFSSLIAENVKWGFTFNVFQTAPGVTVRNVQISNALIHSTFGSYFEGTAENPIASVTCRDCRFTVDGGEVTSEILPHFPLFKSYTFPFGFAFRHTKNCTMTNCVLDAKPPFTAVLQDDCDGLDVMTFQTASKGEMS